MRKLLNSELGRKSIEQFREAEKSPFIIILDNVRSQSNVGSIFRTADAFVTEAIFLCGITSTPPHREIQKTALGATETVTWKYFPHTIDAVKNLKEKGVKPSIINALKYYIIYPKLWFLKTYFRHKGFIDGVPGFVFCLFSALRYWRIYYILITKPETTLSPEVLAS